MADIEGFNHAPDVDRAKEAFLALTGNKPLSLDERSSLRNDIIEQDRIGIAISAMLFNVADTTPEEQERAIDCLITLGYAQNILSGPKALRTITVSQREKIVDYVVKKRDGDAACSILESSTWKSLTGYERKKILQTIAATGQSAIFGIPLFAQIAEGFSEEERQIVFSTPS